MLFFFLEKESCMQLKMDAGRTIYAAIETLLSLVAPEQAIITSVNLAVVSKADHKVEKSTIVHFVFDQPDKRLGHVGIYWANPQERVGTFNGIKIWEKSAFKIDPGVLMNGINNPLYKAVSRLVNQLGGDWEKYEFEASWLLGQPKPIKLKSLTAFGNQFRYKIEAEEDVLL